MHVCCCRETDKYAYRDLPRMAPPPFDKSGVPFAQGKAARSHNGISAQLQRMPHLPAVQSTLA